MKFDFFGVGVVGDLVHAGHLPGDRVCGVLDGEDFPALDATQGDPTVFGGTYEKAHLCNYGRICHFAFNNQ